MSSKLKIAAVSSAQLTPLDDRLFNEFCAPLPGAMPIFHFLSLAFFETLIRSGQLSLKRCDMFTDDPEDGRLPERNKLEHSRTVSDLNQNYSRNIVFASPAERHQQGELIRRNTFVHCWFSGRPEDSKMWQKYGQQERGICIVSTVDGLTAAMLKLEGLGNTRIARAFYFDKSAAITTIPLDAVPFLKHESFAHEKEIRASFFPRGSHENLKLDAVIGRLSVPVDLASLVKGVIFGRLTTLSERESIANVIRSVLGTKVLIETRSGSTPYLPP